MQALIPQISPLQSGPRAEQPSLEERLRDAERRAAEAEDRDRGNQNFYARRYGEQCARLEAERAAWNASRDREAGSEQYLRLYRRAVYFRDRLARYEEVESLLGQTEPLTGPSESR